MITFNNSVVNAGETPAIIAGLWVDAPANAQTPIGVIYIATDTLLIWRNDGVAWQPLAAGGGAADINTVLGIGYTAIDKIQIMQDTPGDHDTILETVGLTVNDYTTGEKAKIQKNNIYISDAGGDFNAGMNIAPGVQAMLYARTDKYGFFVDAAGQQIYFYEYSTGNRINLLFPSGLASNYDVTIPAETGTLQLQSIFGGNINVTAINYTIPAGSYNQYFNVIGAGAGDIICNNMSTFPDGSEVKLCVKATSFNLLYAGGNFYGDSLVNKKGLITLKVFAGDIYCSQLA